LLGRAAVRHEAGDWLVVAAHHEDDDRGGHHREHRDDRGDEHRAGPAPLPALPWPALLAARRAGRPVDTAGRLALVSPRLARGTPFLRGTGPVAVVAARSLARLSRLPRVAPRRRRGRGRRRGRPRLGLLPGLAGAR